MHSIGGGVKASWPTAQLADLPSGPMTPQQRRHNLLAPFHDPLMASCEDLKSDGDLEERLTQWHIRESFGVSA
jgi:hypothetical protein